MTIKFLIEHLSDLHFFLVHRIKLLTDSLQILFKRMIVTYEPLQMSRLIFKLGFQAKVLNLDVR